MKVGCYRVLVARGERGEAAPLPVRKHADMHHSMARFSPVSPFLSRRRQIHAVVYEALTT